MAGSHVVVRIAATGTLFGEAVARYPGSRVTAIVSGQHDHQGRAIVDHMALVEGLPREEVAEILLGWERRYGEAPQVLGEPHALRLPVALDLHHSPVASAILRLEQELPDACCRLRDGSVEVWKACASVDEAERLCRDLRPVLQGMPVLWVGTAEPRSEDADCWSVLRLAAAQVVPDCLLAA
ncbi:MAG TPA: hypothetical protein VJ874_05600 [Candidatus Thermoplasmatota archaeon]|nr:hypothetical protein [Candidatus Thermoplasmatota archaeon]